MHRPNGLAEEQSVLNFMRIVCISDTHSFHRKSQLPDGDVLIHAGDFLGASRWAVEQVDDFDRWLGEQVHRHKIVVAGNHDELLEEVEDPQCLFRHACYLQDAGVDIEGWYFWGSPWSVEFMDWAFMKSERELARVYEAIPARVDVLITHGPAYGILDACPAIGRQGKKREQSWVHVGSKALRLQLAERLRPRLHVCGHIHEGYGMLELEHTLHVNAAQMTGDYRYRNPPIVVDLVARPV